ncbi:MAG: hypothetical protein K2Q06_03385, partial [Parvularculaceae bacterium]|nr:hypothetical protein [Parvularculaceae bacterium]
REAVALAPDGSVRVVRDDMPCANPITMHDGRLIAGECRPGGRIMELGLSGGAPRLILGDVPMPNAFAVGPDGKLYAPIMGVNEIWRIDLGSGAKETVAGDLGVPDSVKFDSKGFIVSTQVASGQVLRIDPRSGARTVLADLNDGLDNVTFVGERIFVSNISGYVVEVLAGGATRNLVPDGFINPLGLAFDGAGELFVADGAFTYLIDKSGVRRRVAFLFTPGCPGYVRGVVSAGEGEWIVTTSLGQVARWRPAASKSEVIAEGYERLYGVALAPGGAVVFADAAGGRILSAGASGVETLASGLAEPMGVAVGADGAVYASEHQGGRVVRSLRGRKETLVDGLGRPQGVALRDGALLVVDAGAKSLLSVDLARGSRAVVAEALPIGPPAGVTPKDLKAVPPLSGAMGPFADVAVDASGVVYVGADAEGSVLRLSPRR